MAYLDTPIGPVRFSYNPLFFSRNSVFLSQQISWNIVSACFFSKSNGAISSTIELIFSQSN